MRQWARGVAEFFFAPESDLWLAILRVGLGLQVVIYGFSLRSDWAFFFAAPAQALISRQLSEALVAAQSPLIPTLAWLVGGANRIGVDDGTALFVIWMVLLLAGLLLMGGLFCRASAFTAWLLHLCAAKSGDLLSYGVDNFMTIGLFYLMLSPLPDRHALDWKLWPRKGLDPSIVGLFRRVLQLHLCIIYFFGGLTKCLGAGWWDGSNIWRALTRPPFNVISPEIIVTWRHFLPALGIAIWVVELGYPVLIWPKKTRMLWLTLVCGMHLAIGLTMGMYLFALIMLVLNLAAFGAPTRLIRAAASAPSATALPS